MTGIQRDALASDDGLPIDLRYPDPYPLPNDLGAIIRVGRRVRNRRRFATVAGSLSTIAVVFAAALGVHQMLNPSQGSPATALDAASIVKSYPPVDRISILGTYADARPANWSAVAWLSTNGYLCYGGADLRSTKQGPSVSCVSASSALTRDASRGPVPGWPVFRTAPSRPGSFLAIGLVRGPAARVEVTANGTNAFAEVVPVTSDSGSAVGAYAIWLPSSGDGTIHSSDITRVAALDDAGHVLSVLP